MNITANITAIICYIAWVQSPFMKEAKNDLCLAKRQSQAREHPSIGNKRKTYILQFMCDFCELVVKNKVKT